MMEWYAKNAPPDNIKGIRGIKAQRVYERLIEIDQMSKVDIRVSENL